MKRLMFVLVLVAVIGGGTWPVFAEDIVVKGAGHSDQTISVHDKTIVQDAHNTVGAKVDAPNLVRFTDDLTFGIEGGKDIMRNAFYQDEADYFEADRGYFAYAKVTYTGSLFDFRKK